MHDCGWDQHRRWVEKFRQSTLVHLTDRDSSDHDVSADQRAVPRQLLGLEHDLDLAREPVWDECVLNDKSAAGAP